MKVNARGGGIDAQALKAGAKALQEAAYTQRDHAVALEKGEALLPAGPADATPHLSFSERLLAAERRAPDSPVDWSALPNLRKATPAAMPTFMATSAVIGNLLAWPRMPSVPK